MADLATRMCRERNAFDGAFTPLDIVDKLLAKEGKFTESEGFTISFGGFGLNYPVVRPVREKACRAKACKIGTSSAIGAFRFGP